MELIPYVQMEIVSIGATHTLTAWEIDMVQAARHRRTDSNISANLYRDPVDNKRPAEEIELDGCSAEVAFCRLHNVYCDLVSDARLPSEDDGDATVGPWRVDVKARPDRDPAWLLVSNRNGKPPAPLYALMTGRHPTWTFRGFMIGQELFQESRLTQIATGKPKMFKAFEDELYSLESAAGKLYDDAGLVERLLLPVTVPRTGGEKYDGHQ